MQIIFNFFFEYQASTLFLAIYRILICSTVLIFLIYNHSGFLFFSNPEDNSLYSLKAYLKKTNNYLNILTFSSKRYYRNLLFIILYISCIFSLIGLYTNISLIIFFITYVSFEHRTAIAMSSGGTIILNTLLLFLILTNSGLKLSIDSLFLNNTPDYIDGWPLRIIQIMISFGFFQAALIKLHSSIWWNGEMIKRSLFSNFGKENKLTFFIYRNKLVNKSLNYLTLFYQLFSPLLLWTPEFRIYGIIIGCFLHFGMVLTLYIGYFGIITMIAILSFANNYF